MFKKDIHREKQDTLNPSSKLSYEPWQKYEDIIYSLAIEDIMSFGENTFLTLGVRYDKRNSILAQEYGVPEWDSVLKKGYLFNFPTKDDDAFNYQALFEHSFDNNDKIYLSIAKKTYFPTQKERYSSRFGRYIQNPNLKPENAMNYEIAYERKFENLKLSSAVFYNDVRDKIESVLLTNKMYQNQNVGKARIFGVEIDGNVDINDIWKLGGNYTYMNADAKKQDVYLTDLPKHKFFLYSDLQIMPNFKFYTNLYGQSGAHSNSDGTYAPSGFGVMNVKFIYEPMRNFSLDFGVENLFDKDYAYTEGYYESGRSFVFNARYRY